MKISILTTTYKRPFLLKRLAESVIPLINKLDGQLDWRIIIDDDTDDNYDTILDEIDQKVKNKNLLNWKKHKNIGKFRSLNKLFNNKSNSDWLVNIDDDDLIINYKFEDFIQHLSSIKKDVKAIIVPRLILNIPFYHFRVNKKIKFFSKYKNQKMSYFQFKEKIGDFDTTIFVRKSTYFVKKYKEVENDKFTPESLRWLDAYPENDMLILNQVLTYSQYLEDGITKFTDKNRILNYKSTILTYKKFLEFKKFNLSLILIKSLVNYYRFSFHSSKKINFFDERQRSIIFFICYVLGKFLFLYDRIIFKKKG